MSTWDELWDPTYATRARQRRPGRHAAPPVGEPARRTGPGPVTEARHTVRREVRRLHGQALVPLFGGYLLLLFLCWAAPDLLGTAVVGGVTIGVVLLLGQFLLAFRVMRLFSRDARTRLDPEVARLRALAETASAESAAASTAASAAAPAAGPRSEVGW